MRIAAVSAALPSRRVTNDDILGLVREHSAAGFEGDMEDALRKISFWLAYSGSEARLWSTEQERPIDLLVRAAEQALDEAGMARESIDVVIYTGIGRGFLEPGGAYHAAAALGIERAQCFDVLDACMSWTRAVQLAEGLFASGACRTAMLVNAEFNMRPGGAVYPDVFTLRHADEITWSFPAYTLGEAASATILTAEGETPWSFEFSSRPDLAELCNIPMAGYADFSLPSEKVARNGVGRFTSFGFDLHEAARIEAMEVFKRLDAPADEVTAVFTHASSKRFWQEMADTVGLRDQIFHVFQDTGNIVSASVPTAIATAVGEGRLSRGDRAIGWVGSAGMSFSAFSFVY
ncbi:3-oxoacyl-[acyl-carrier-protein] synthase III C-terminal domain-containing protein [Streptomyces sp. NPDC059452]|uniref:3-oxoacyl-[acyl-carrier-protein] synthase III C-terminal domain-containing protein n=1 Tax=Streptomyces sp. NPDC059452 TaxID=3346835 RepID=UPI0036BBE2FC